MADVLEFHSLVSFETRGHRVKARAFVTTNIASGRIYLDQMESTLCLILVTTSFELCTSCRSVDFARFLSFFS
jgi:hypothetical protein